MRVAFIQWRILVQLGILIASSVRRSISMKFRVPVQRMLLHYVREAV